MSNDLKQDEGTAELEGVHAEATESENQGVDETNEPSSTQMVDEPLLRENKVENSLKRWLGESKVRFTLISLSVGFLVLGGGVVALKNAFTGEEIKSDPSEVVVPKTKVGQAAIVNEEQANHIRQKQIKDGEEAEKNGETYLPSFVVVEDKKDETLAPATQPGLKTPEITNERTYRDKEGKIYTSEEALTLLNSGVVIEGVTRGKGSMLDLSNSPKQLNSNAPRNAETTLESKTSTDYEPYVVKPYVPNSQASNVVQSELVIEQNTVLDKSNQSIDEWQDQYLAMRLKKANLVNQKTQLAVEEQILKLERWSDTDSKNGSQTSNYSSTIYSLPTERGDDYAISKVDQRTSTSTQFKPLIYAGESNIAVLKNEVNSDNGSEVIAVLSNGPFKGSTITGSIVKTNDNIQFSFNRLLRKGKSEIPISAVGRQIGTNSSGMADEIKKHYLVRYSALVASSALSGVGKSYEQTSGVNSTISNNGTVVTNSTDPSNNRILGNAVGELGDEISSEIKDLSKKPTTYITRNGKVFNVFFNLNVLDNMETTAVAQKGEDHVNK